MTKYWTPPTFFTQNFFCQNDSEWPKMDFKHNFKKYGILSVSFNAFLDTLIINAQEQFNLKSVCIILLEVSRQKIPKC